MIDLSSTAHGFCLLNGLADTVNNLPALFNHLNILADISGIKSFTNFHGTSINTVAKMSEAWLKIASTSVLMTQTQAEICKRLKQSEKDWVAEFDGGPWSARQLSLHEQLLSHGLLVKTFVPGFVLLTKELDECVAKAIPALSLMSTYMQQWQEAMAACDLAGLHDRLWVNLLDHLLRTAINLDPNAGEWLVYEDVRQALTAVRRAGHLLLIAPVTAAQHATGDFGILAKELVDCADQLNAMQPEQPPSVYQRHLTFAVLSCDSARLHCEHLLALKDESAKQKLIVYANFSLN